MLNLSRIKKKMSWLDSLWPEPRFLAKQKLGSTWAKKVRIIFIQTELSFEFWLTSWLDSLTSLTKIEEKSFLVIMEMN